MKSALIRLVLFRSPRTELQYVLGTIHEEPDLDALAFDRAAQTQIEHASNDPALTAVVDRTLRGVLTPECSKVCVGCPNNASILCA
jgi:hypothetical protein